MMRIGLLALLAACWGDNAYIVEGTVLEKTSDVEIVVAHEDIPGLMKAMTMPFEVRDPAILARVSPGDRITARLHVEQGGSHLAKVRVTGKGMVPADYRPQGPGPVRPGAVLPRTEVPLSDGGTLTLGPGQDRPVALTFFYTRCPIPEFCPKLTGRLQALQEAVGTDAWVLAVTLDPEGDDPETRAAFAERAGARPDVWRFGRPTAEALDELALLAGLSVLRERGEILHALRLLVVDREGRLVERYDDADWPLERVVEQLRTGRPHAPPGSSGTRSP